jgi:hypothetical protein
VKHEGDLRGLHLNTRPSEHLWNLGTERVSRTNCYTFSLCVRLIAAVTNNHQLCGLKQHKLNMFEGGTGFELRV